LSAISSSVTLPTFSAQSFSLNNLDQVTQLTAVFDQYKIRQVELNYIPNASTGVSVTAVGLFSVVVDYDDAVNFSSSLSALDYPNCTTVPGDQSVKKVFTPAIAVAAYSGAFTSFSNKSRQWIDCSSPGVIHYGCKTSSTTTSAVLTYSIIGRMLVSFRNVR